MLKLKNIRRNNGIIAANYDPENTGELGFVSLDFQTGEVIESRASKYDEDMPVYLRHSISALKKLTEEEILPEEKMVMWY